MRKLKRYVIKSPNKDAPDGVFVVPRDGYQMNGWDAHFGWSEKCLVDEDFMRWFMAKGPDPRFEVYEVEIKPRRVFRDVVFPARKSVRTRR